MKCNDHSRLEFESVQNLMRAGHRLNMRDRAEVLQASDGKLKSGLRKELPDVMVDQVGACRVGRPGSNMWYI